MATTLRALRLTDDELEILRGASSALHCSESEVLRWGLTVIVALLRDGLTSGVHFGEDGGPDAVSLTDARGVMMTLRRKSDGAFALASRSVYGDWPGDDEDGE